MDATYTAIDAECAVRRGALKPQFIALGLLYGASCLCIGSILPRSSSGNEKALHESRVSSSSIRLQASLAAAALPDAACATVALAEDEVLPWLRSRAFNKRTEDALANHPMVRAADAGRMPLEAVRLVLLEEFSIETSDIRSMAVALGRHAEHQSAIDFFQAATASENVARQKLLQMAAAMGLSVSALEAYDPMPAAHAYTAYLTELANYGGMGAIAAGFAVNFPAYGRMCGRMRDALIDKYGMAETDVAFLSWFAAPLGASYDVSAAAVIADGRRNGETLCQIERGVRLLQAYERMFWDAVWARANCSQDLTEPLHF